MLLNHSPFSGRQRELQLLEEAYYKDQSQIFALIGRRRIGKSRLIDEFSKNKPHLFFEALEGEHTPEQINHFTRQLKSQLKDPILDSVTFSTWNDAFSYLTSQLAPNKKRVILFFDELQWMAAGRSHLVSLIKFYWDNHWKQINIFLILCGSIASFMINKVIRSKALYGRLTGEIHLKPLSPKESVPFFKNKRSLDEILNYLLVFGGIPKYLELIQLNHSFKQNITTLCFSPNGVMVDEFKKIFYGHFKRHRVYQKIAQKLKNGMYSLQDLSQALKMTSSGGISRYLDQMENADFIKSYVPFDKKLTSKLKKYRLWDEYLFFYFQYIEPNLRIIQESPSSKVFDLITKNNWEVWLGFAFERFCLKYSSDLAKIMGFADEVIQATPYFEKKDHHFQIDLAYKRADRVITICEVKYYHKPIPTKIIPEVEKKCQQFPLPKGYTLERALISKYGPSQELRDSQYFHHFVNMKDIFS